MINNNFEEEEKEFLGDVAIDYVSIHNIFGIIAGGFHKTAPNKEEFDLMMELILFLFNKYGKNFGFTSGPGDKIDKSIHELLKWLVEEYNRGNYWDISYSIWFDLDELVIPKEYLPKPYTDVP